MRALLAVGALCVVVVAATAGPDSGVGSEPVVDGAEAGWLKGQLHFHTANSRDSTELPADMLDAYDRAGYDFVIVTDHNFATDAEHPRVEVYTGVELEQADDRCDPQPFNPEGKEDWCLIHVGALFVPASAPEQFPWGRWRNGSPLGLMEFLIETALNMEGLVAVNHPDLHAAVSGPLIVEAFLRGASLVEIANVSTHPDDIPHDDAETLWDYALSQGVELYGIAVDDAHSVEEIQPGWVMVRAENTSASISEALLRGDFYASTGIELSELKVSDTVRVAVAGTGSYRLDVIGPGGDVLHTTNGSALEFPLPSAGFIRIVVTGPGGAQAWTQPFARGW